MMRASEKKDFGTAIILAGGGSTRMGFDKQLIEIKNGSLVKNTIFRLGKIFNEIIVVSGKAWLYEGLDVTVVIDELSGCGPLGGIHAGLKHSKSVYGYVIACDMPNINLPYIDHMMKKLEGKVRDACVTRYREWIEPFNAFYSRQFAEKIETHARDTLTLKPSINFLLRNSNTLFIGEKTARKFSPDWGMFLNLNTGEELGQFIEETG